MDELSLKVATLLSVFVAITFLYSWYCMQTKVVRIERSQTPWPAVWPKLSVIIPIRNEERNLKEALQSLLHETYPEIEILAINDRSEDGSGKILAEMQLEHPRLKVKTIETLPAGWLGKNHALHVGYQASQGELVLFTDADVLFKKGTLQKMVALMLEGKWDHVCALVQMESSSPVMRCVESFFGFFLVLFLQPWRVSDARAKNALGIGAFNLIRRPVLDAIGGMQKVRMRPDDDIRLGQAIKGSGFRQIAVGAMENLKVEWYPSLRVCILAFEKNMFAGFDYSVVKLFALSTVGIVLHTVPTLVPWFATGVWKAVGIASFTAIYLTLFAAFRLAKAPLWSVPFYVPTTFLIIFIFWRTAILNIWRGGLHWRGTFYSLEELKKNK